MSSSASCEISESAKILLRGEKALMRGRVFEVLDTVDFGSSASTGVKVVGRNGLRAGPALARRCGSIKTDGSRKRMSEAATAQPSGLDDAAADNHELVGILKDQPDVAVIVSRASAVARPLRGSMRLAKRSLGSDAQVSRREG